MKKYLPVDLEKYLKEDILLVRLEKYQSDKEFASHKWLLDIPAKRLIYTDIYWDLLNTKNKKILDIGGGFCGLTRELLKNHNYTLVDIMAHDDHQKMKNIELEIGKFWVNSDWFDFETEEQYDVIIANDIFPNVDQRLKKFIEKFRSHTKKMILTLTCYDKDMSYKVKRIDADEVFTIEPWTSSITSLVLSESLGNNAPILIKNNDQSIFKNGRVVYKVIL